MKYSTNQIATLANISAGMVILRANELFIKGVKIKEKLYYTEEEKNKILNFKNINKGFFFSECGNYLIIQSKINYVKKF